MKNKKGKLSINIDVLIIIVIGICMIFLNIFTLTKLSELENAGKSAIFVRDDIQFIEDETLSEEIRDYIPEAYKMIELYDENFDLLFQVQFNDPDSGYVVKNSIQSYPTLFSLLNSLDEGQTSVNIDGKDENVYFRWVINNRGEKRLLMVYSSITKVRGLWLFSLVSYIVIVLVFVLLIRSYFRQYHEKLNKYQEMTEIIQNELNV